MVGSRDERYGGAVGGDGGLGVGGDHLVGVSVGREVSREMGGG